MQAGTLGLTFGADASHSEGLWQGLIDEVRLWSIPRSDQEIADNMNRALFGDEAGLLGYWRMDESSGQVIYDSVGRMHGSLGLNSYVQLDDPTWVGGILTFDARDLGSSLSFDGGDSVRFFDQANDFNSITNRMTIECWVRPCETLTVGSPNQTIYTKGTASGTNTTEKGWFLRHVNGTLQFAVHTTSNATPNIATATMDLIGG